MKKALASAEADIYIFNAYNYTEYSGFLNFTGFSIFKLINYEDYDGVIILSDLIDNPRILERERQRILKAGVPAIAINKKINGTAGLLPLSALGAQCRRKVEDTPYGQGNGLP